ncbi:hypothetical protein KC872_00825 [Candidatus Kaiserbacteria bacterium]|nr:hypothetical protein [Candidatus Kaiserbacteria bacterium]
MFFGINHGAKAHLYVSGTEAEVVYKDQKLRATIIAHDGYHGVRVKLNTPILQVTVTVIKRLFRDDIQKESIEWIDELTIWEDDVMPI